MRAGGDRREGRPEDRGDLVLLDELLEDRDALILGRAVIFDDELDLLATALEPAGRVELIDRELRAVGLLRVVEVRRARLRRRETHLDVGQRREAR